jgi:tripartite-type tricarboxylate transporter receptor subunit TctC
MEGMYGTEAYKKYVRDNFKEVLTRAHRNDGGYYALADIPSALQHVQSGRLRALAMAAPERSQLLPQLPTATEAGLPGYVAQTWGGLSVRVGTPAEIVNKLNNDIVRVLRDPETRERMQGIGAEPVPQTPKQYGDFIRSEMTKWDTVVKRAKLTMN